MDGREQPDRVFGGRLARQLLRMLAVRRGTLLSKDVAVEALWPTHRPADASGNVEILVSRIRRVLGDRSLIQTGSGGYTLVGDDRCWVDVEAFLSAAGRGQAELNHDRAAALSAFEAALHLWRGEPLVEDAYADWAAEHRRHLFRAHLDALEGAAIAALAVGEITSAVAWAQAAAERHPLREASALLLVRALTVGGDRAAALATFDAFGRRLADELGIDPSAEALEMRQRVLRDEMPPVPVPRSAPPDERLPSEASGLASPFPGHGEVCTRITDLLADRQVRVVIVGGGPGSGKSKLLAELVDRVGMPTVLVRAQRAHRDDPGALAATILRTLGVGEDTADACQLGAVAGWSDAVPESAACDDGAVRAVRVAVRAAQAVAR
ncbi:MAG: winged helix-turn-helix domain-containing protein, partial [Pseudonocardia sp.]|nr:winged helix-turn-helix domain-containing protein [Pseudonocardia sp.]